MISASSPTGSSNSTNASPARLTESSSGMHFIKNSFQHLSDLTGSFDNNSPKSERSLYPFPAMVAPAPVTIQVAPGHPVFSIDVECVATGDVTRHKYLESNYNSRVICRCQS